MSDSAAQARSESTALYRRIMWRILPIMLLCYAIALIDRSNVGVAKLQFLGDLGFSNAVYGFGGGIFYVGYLLFEIPSNLYLARVGARKTLLRIMVIWGPCCAAMALMTSASHYYLLRFLLGAAEAGFLPGMLLYLTYWIPASRRAMVTAIFMSGSPISGLLGGPLAGWIMHAMDGVAGMRGWQWLFIIEGLPAVLLGIVAYLHLDDRPERSRWLSPSDKATILHDLRTDDDGKAETAHTSFRAVLRDGRFYALGALAIGIMVSVGGSFLWIPTIIQQSGVQSVLDVGLLSALPFVVATAAQLLVAKSSDRMQERRWHAVVPSLIGAAGWAALPSVSDSPALALLVLTVATAGSMSAMGTFWTLPTQYLSGAATPGAMAMLTTLGSFGLFVSPILVGWLFDRTGSLASGQYYFAALLLIGSLLVTFSFRKPTSAAMKFA